jgi:hypothetical protein
MQPEYNEQVAAIARAARKAAAAEATARTRRAGLVCVYACVCVYVCVCVCGVCVYRCAGLARTIYIRCTYGDFDREITKYTLIYGVYIRFWPTLQMCVCVCACILVCICVFAFVVEWGSGSAAQVCI